MKKSIFQNTIYIDKNRKICYDVQYQHTKGDFTMPQNIIKTWVDKEKGISLTFTLNEKGLYIPSSNNETINNWLLNETKKKGEVVPVKKQQIIHVVNAAKERLAHPEKQAEKQSAQENRAAKLWQENPINALQEHFQSPANCIKDENGKIIVPTYQTVNVMQGNGSQVVTVALTLPTGETIYTSAGSAKDAKRLAAMEYGRDVLNVFGTPEKKAQNITPASSSTKTSAPRGYYQLGDVFSVDAEGNSYKLPKTEYQIFLGPDLWLGRVGKKFTMYRHTTPIASFEWGKSNIYGGGTFNEEKFRNALGKEINEEEFYSIMDSELEKQDTNASYALYRGKPGTSLEQARRCAFLRPATSEEFYETVEGYLEYYRLDDKIKEAEKRTHGAHGGNYDMLMGKVWDLESEQNDIDNQILDNNKLFAKVSGKEKQQETPSNETQSSNNALAFALQQALKNSGRK